MEKVNKLCECDSPGFCHRHKMSKDARLYKNCAGTASTGDCGRKYWVSWEQGLLGATPPENPVPNPEWECVNAVIDDKFVSRERKSSVSARGPSHQYVDECRVGSKVKEMVKRKYGARTSEACECNKKALQMDLRGCKWCRENIDTIVQWLKEGAAERLWMKPIVKLLGGTVEDRARMLAMEAIEHEEKRTSKTKNPHTKTWVYGITTVANRLDNLLLGTIDSLHNAGFDSPWLFIDGLSDSYRLETLRVRDVPLSEYNHTIHSPKLKTFGNWILALWELYIREPRSKFYALFQDDLVTYRNLRQYLEGCEYPFKGKDRGYWNLYTFPQNQILSKDKQGWFESNQKGLGAVALVFCRECVIDLLSSREHIVERPSNRGRRSWANIDGGIVSALNKAGKKKDGWKEYVHNPSLVQHTGIKSSMNGARHPLAKSFLGEKYDATRLLTQ